MRILITIILFALASAASAATNVARVTAIVEGFTGQTSTAQQLNRLTTRLLPLAQAQIAADGKSIGSLTNEEKAGYVLSVLKANAQDLLRRAARDQEQAAVAASVTANATTAVGDLQ